MLFELYPKETFQFYFFSRIKNNLRETKNSSSSSRFISPRKIKKEEEEEENLFPSEKWHAS